MFTVRINDYIENFFNEEIQRVIRTIPIVYAFGDLPQPYAFDSFALPMVEGVDWHDIGLYRSIDFNLDQFIHLLNSRMDKKCGSASIYFAECMEKAFEYGWRKTNVALMYLLDIRGATQSDRPYTYNLPLPEDRVLRWIAVFDRNLHATADEDKLVSRLKELFFACHGGNNGQ